MRSLMIAAVAALAFAGAAEAGKPPLHHPRPVCNPKTAHLCGYVCIPLKKQCHT